MDYSLKCSSEFEADVLRKVQRELRIAMKMKGQLSLIIDPYADGSGANIFASPSTMGRSYKIDRKKAPPRAFGGSIFPSDRPG